uniref:Mitochondrial antiviral-signaling protein n=1 Tax=Gasterosteus aculeatus aculeatus TaxID=481459 RepID=G3NM93_GASAC
MSFANDRLYNGYMRRKMPTIVTQVKVREIMIHLPCLTPHDRENIEAKRETNGNFDSMVLLLDCLKRRENWPQQFIDALEACEHTTLAADMRAEYDALRGVSSKSLNSSSPPATVVRAHVHPAPSARPPSVPEGGANSQAAAAPPAEESAPPEPAPQAQLPEAVPPPGPLPEPPQATEVEVAARPSTPPTSFEPVAAEATPAQGEVNAPQEPEENSESDIQDVPGDNGVTPAGESGESGEVSADRASAPPPGPCETDTPSHTDPLQTTTTSAQVGPPTSPSLTQMDSDVTDGSSFLTMTPERLPVQDTAAQVDLKPAVVLQPEESFQPAATQVVETEVAAPTPPLPGANGADAVLRDDYDDMCLSKPGQLVSVHPANNGRPTASAPVPPAQPYSGDSGRLEISDASTEVSDAAPPPVAACQENGVPLSRNEPEENHYEGRSSGVMTHVVHVSQEASVLDLDGQSPAPARIPNGEAAEEVPSAPPAAPPACTAGNSPSGKACDPSGPAGISPPWETAAHAKYIAAAAGVGACALLLAWRFKN